MYPKYTPYTSYIRRINPNKSKSSIYNHPNRQDIQKMGAYVKNTQNIQKISKNRPKYQKHIQKYKKQPGDQKHTHTNNYNPTKKSKTKQKKQKPKPKITKKYK